MLVLHYIYTRHSIIMIARKYPLILAGSAAALLVPAYVITNPATLQAGIIASSGSLS